MLASASDSLSVKVYFLYGSKPAKEYRNEESKWFGGKLGGHAGVAVDSGEIVNFLPNGSLHIFPSRKDQHAGWTTSSEKSFRRILGGDADSNQLLVIEIPVTRAQYEAIDSIHNSYLDDCPYDYAFMGMRCGAATYDVLAEAGILPRQGRFLTIFRYFYPKRVRKKLLRKAHKYDWKTTLFKGTERRKWEKDRFWLP